VSVPHKVLELRTQLLKVQRQLLQQQQAPPSLAQVAAAAGVSVDKAQQALGAAGTALQVRAAWCGACQAHCCFARKGTHQQHMCHPTVVPLHAAAADDDAAACQRAARVRQAHARRGCKRAP
jgi:hypothetical protein